MDSDWNSVSQQLDAGLAEDPSTRRRMVSLELYNLRSRIACTGLALAALCVGSAAHAHGAASRSKLKAETHVLVPARTFIDTERWTCLVDPRGDVYCVMRSDPEAWPAPAISSTGSRFEKVSGLAEVTALEAMSEYVCALDRRGVVQCWGCLYSMCRLWPKQIALSERAVQVVVESVGACALLESGSVQCWGSGWSGQFGSGESEARVSEQPVKLPLSARATQLSATTDARCALDDQGKVTCWGDVCRGDDPLGLKPRRMPGLEQVSAIAANASFTCAVVGPQREVRCWGYPDFGQTSMQATTGLPHRHCEIGQVRTLRHVKQLALGYLSGAALTEEGALYHWGQSHHGGAQPQRPRRFDQEPVRIAAGLDVQRVMLSGSYTCLELAGGEVRCEWPLSKTTFHIETVWPSVHFDSGVGGPP